MTLGSQPTDAEYLRTLMERERSPVPAELREMQRRRCYEAVAEMVDKGFLDRYPIEGKEYRSAATYLQRLLDQYDAAKVFQDYALEALREKALACLGDKRSRLAEVPVGIFSTRELNGFAIRTPRGGAAIALYSALWLLLKIAYYCIFAIMFRRTRHAIGSQHSDEVYAVNLLQTVAALRSGGIITMARDGEYSIADCVGESSRPEPAVVGYVDRTLLFILLHEYGHVWHDHFDNGMTRSKNIANETAEIYTTTQGQEFEADGFAISHLWGDDPRAVNDNYAALFSITVLFSLFDLCEGTADRPVVGTHPRALDRLVKVLDVCRNRCADHTWREFEGSLTNVQRSFHKLKALGVDRGII